VDERTDIRWRIDAWDSLAGRAFMCLRATDGNSDPQLDHSAVFVAPPYFQPEPLASRAPGLAATRGTFQAGLFFDGEEVGFATLADAIAYIKRGYNSNGSPFSGGSTTRRTGPLDLAGGGGLALELPKDPKTDGFKGLDQAIAARITDFTKAVANVGSDDPAKVVNWSLDLKVLEHADELLVFAAQHLALEMLRTLPVKGTPDDYAEWARGTRNLTAQLVRLGLWGQVQEELCKRIEGHRKSEELMKMLAMAVEGKWKEMHRVDVSHIVDVLFLHPRWQSWDLDRLTETDVNYGLASFPLPQSIASKYPTQLGATRPTLLGLLSAWFGRPRDRDVLPLERALLLFAGACVVIGPLQQETPLYRPWWIDRTPQMLQAFRHRLGRDTWAWLSKQLPDRAFRRELEEMLRNIPDLWSGAAQAKSPSPRKPDPIEDPTADVVKALSEDLGDVISDFEEEKNTAAKA
jgi:hypothetical protein